jgi:hypothetical protein
MNIEQNNGTLTIFAATDMLGIEIHYSGNITINPTLPDNWLCRANKNKIIIFSLGTNKLQVEQELFTYTGKLNIKYAFATPNGIDKKIISISNPKRTWDNIYYKGADYTSMTDTWDNMQSKNESNTIRGYKSIVNTNHIKITDKLLKTENLTTKATISTTKPNTGTTGGY